MRFVAFLFLLGVLVFTVEARPVLETVPASPLAPGASFAVIGCGFSKPAAKLYGDALGRTSWDQVTYLFDVDADGCITAIDSPTFVAPSAPGTYQVTVCQRNVQNTDPCKVSADAVFEVR